MTKFEDILADRVLFIDGEALIIDKPAGLPVGRTRAGGPSVEGLAKTLTFGFRRPPLIVHRLDQDTSGCLLMARNPKVLKRFNAAFEAGEVFKRYLAVLDGVPEGEFGVIDLPLSKVSSAEKGWRIIGDPAGKAALTRWRKLGDAKGRALIEFIPETGRTHQLRVHAASGLGLPIWGDPVYGRAQGALMLHAVALSVPRAAKPPAEAEAPLPPSFAALGFSL